MSEQPVKQSFSFTRPQLAAEMDMLVDMLVEGGKRDQDRDNIRGQIGMLKKIMDGKELGARAKAPKAPEPDPNRGSMYGAT